MHTPFRSVFAGAALFAFFASLGVGVHSLAPSSPQGSLEFASKGGGAWNWSGSKFSQGARCERVFLGPFMGPASRRAIPGPYRKESTRKLKFLEFNMLNLFERDFSLTDQKFNKGTDVKTEAQREGLARIIRKSDPDIMTWVEVENFRAAELFSDRYLDKRYQVFLMEGNDPRGIDVAVLVKKDLPFEVEYRSLKDLAEVNSFSNHHEPEVKVFSRDLPMAIFRRLDGGMKKEEFILLSTHYKSQRGNQGSFPKRLLQAEATESAVQHLRREFGDDLPIILTGDFNNDVPSSPEFAPLWRAGFKDSFDLSKNPIPK
ncbi:MAG TPA: hypothetical protein PL182_13915, partial [Pseudobdellovibrionaceae bacterium]|nr:hypothetical protein [Pseudobdellovibrionaceae bacterium]